jgi:SAM-dependent methyltransferase
MFGLMFFPDPDAGMRELGRVVRPGGRVGTATWDLDGFSMSSLIGAALAVAVPELADAERPAPTWAPLGAPEGLERLLRDAGLLDVQVRRVERRWHFDRPAEFFRDMPSWSSPVKPLFDLLPPDRIDAAASAFATELDAAGGTTGGVGLPMTALFATGTVG